jgi:hypothetical protein
MNEGIDGGPYLDPSIEPFPGLRAFEANEEHLFFGREGQSEQILHAMRRTRLLAVVGTSGSGKSSLIRAGLIPYLYGGFLAGATSRWRIAILRPGGDPIGALARAIVEQGLLADIPSDAEQLQRQVLITSAALRRSGLGLVELVRLARLPEGENVLVVVDQFEELFRFGETGLHRGDDAAAFAKLLVEVQRQSRQPIYAVLTMRSDFIGDCARFRDLPEAVTAGLYLVPRLTRAQRREVIEGPVRVAGGSVAPRLVTRLLNDIGDDPDQLPLLQHAMMRAWDHWRGTGEARPIDLVDYDVIGGAAHALSNHADEAYATLDADGQALARILFQCLTEKDADNREARRPTRLEVIASVAEAPLEAVAKVVAVFRAPGRSFLMPPEPVPLEPQTTIDISHESLIRGWRRLRQWVEEEAESAHIYQRLAETAALHAQGKAGLWRDPDLAVALAWRERQRPTAAWAARYNAAWPQATAFLEASSAARAAEARSEADRQAARLRRARQLLAAVCAALVVFAAIAGYAFSEARRAHFAERRATHAQRAADENAKAAQLAAAEAHRRAAEAVAESHRADAEKKHAEEAQNIAEEAKKRAEEDAREVRNEADQSRWQELTQASPLYNVTNFALFFAPPEFSHSLHNLLAEVYQRNGDFESFYREIEAQEKSGSPNITPLAQNSYASTLTADADAVVRDATAFSAQYKNPIPLGNLAMAQIMRGDYAAALRALDMAIAAYRPGLSALTHDIAPDIAAETHHRVIYATDTDFIIGLRYLRAIVFAMSGDAGFEQALAEADTALGPGTQSINPYLLALDFAWLAGRGQAVNLTPRPALAEGPPNYGIYAAQGALWERAAAVQPRLYFAARKAYGLFQDAYAKRPEPRYAAIAAFVAPRLQMPAIKLAEPDLVKEDIRSLALQAEEIRLQTQGNSLFDVEPAIRRLSDAIEQMRRKSDIAPLSRRDRDLMLDMLTQRSLWFIGGQDFVDAGKDAQAAIDLDATSANAFALRAKTQTTAPAANADDEIAIRLDPGNLTALRDLAGRIGDTDPQQAITLWKQVMRFDELPWPEYQKLAQLQLHQRQFADALDSIGKAISLNPYGTDLCKLRREIDDAMSLGKAAAVARLTSCIKSAADAQARLGSDAAAIAIYLQAIRASSEEQDLDDDLRFEQEASVRSLSTLLTQRQGRDRAIAFWQALATDKVITRYASVADAEVKRLTALH